MTSPLSQADFQSRRAAAVTWVETLPFVEATRDEIIDMIKTLVGWDEDVFANSICDELKASLRRERNGSARERMDHILIRVLVIIGMSPSKEKKVPHCLRDLSGPQYWKEVMNDIDRVISVQCFYSNSLHELMLASAKIMPKHITDAIKQGLEGDIEQRILDATDDWRRENEILAKNILHQTKRAARYEQRSRRLARKLRSATTNTRQAAQRLQEVAAIKNEMITQLSREKRALQATLEMSNTENDNLKAIVAELQQKLPNRDEKLVEQENKPESD